MFSNHNLLLDVDSYKLSHYQQYPKGTTHVSSYIESRGGRFDNIVFFGLQAWIKKNLLTPITKENRDEFADIVEAHGFVPNLSDIDYILEKHGGYMPVEIEAVPEGTIVPTKNVLLQMVNTDHTQNHCFSLFSLNHKS
jgi:nicotinamide phosphoribosyltransferase